MDTRSTSALHRRALKHPRRVTLIKKSGLTSSKNSEIKSGQMFGRKFTKTSFQRSAHRIHFRLIDRMHQLNAPNSPTTICEMPPVAAAHTQIDQTHQTSSSLLNFNGLINYNLSILIAIGQFQFGRCFLGLTFELTFDSLSLFTN